MYRSLLSSCLLAAGFVASAQQYVHQVLVLSEGYFDVGTQTQVEPVELFSYDPALGSLQSVAVINGARFGTHVQVHGGNIYVAADGLLLKYDATTYALLDQESVTGIRRFDFWNDQLILSRGEVGGLPHYLEVRDKNTFDLVYAITPADGLEYSGEDVVVSGDKAYIAVNNAFDWANLVGYVGVLDLLNQSYAAVDLGADGLNPENLMVYGNALWTLNNKDFTGSSVSRINLTNGTHELTENIAIGSGCAASEMAEEKVYYMEYAVGHVARYDVIMEAVVDTLPATQPIYGLLNDAINGQFYATTTDFFSTGELFSMDYAGNMTSLGTVGPSPGKLALDVRNAQSVAERTAPSFAILQNATNDLLTVKSSEPINGTLRIIDAMGRTVQQQRVSGSREAMLDVHSLAVGPYAIAIGADTLPFVKR